MQIVFAVIGSEALWFTYGWLASAIIASYLSERKGYGERPGLASGLLLNVVGILVWLVVPPRPGSLWKLAGPFGSKVREERAAGGRGSGAAPIGSRGADGSGGEDGSGRDGGGGGDGGR